MQYTAIAKDGGLFIPNITQFSENVWVKLEISKMETAPNQANLSQLDDVIGILKNKNIDGVAFQNDLR